MTEKPLQIAQSNNFSLVQLPDSFPDTLTWWMEQYFQFEVTTSKRSQKEQRRDIERFIRFVIKETGSDQRVNWSPRLSRAFKDYLLNMYRVQKNADSGEEKKTKRAWSDRTINRMMAHLKTWAKWIHKLMPFPLGNPMHKIKQQPVGIGLEIERALTPDKRRRILDYADRLSKTEGRSCDRHRYRKQNPTERTRRKSFRPYRDRAIIYTLIETGMRTQAITRIDLDNIEGKRIRVLEKGGHDHIYPISLEGLAAINDYIENERDKDKTIWQSPALFLPSSSRKNANERLSTWTINNIWNKVTQKAGVKGKTPHSARHAMGIHVIEKTGNPTAVQRQLGHKNVAYSLQYTRISDKKLEEILNERK